MTKEIIGPSLYCTINCLISTSYKVFSFTLTIPDAICISIANQPCCFGFKSESSYRGLVRGSDSPNWLTKFFKKYKHGRNMHNFRNWNDLPLFFLASIFDFTNHRHLIFILIAPSLICPANQTKVTDRGQSTALVLWTKPSVDFPAEVSIEMCEPASGSKFAIGNTKVVCEAEHNYRHMYHVHDGNTCYFYISVSGRYRSWSCYPFSFWAVLRTFFPLM